MINANRTFFYKPFFVFLFQNMTLNLPQWTKAAQHIENLNMCNMYNEENCAIFRYIQDTKHSSVAGQYIWQMRRSLSAPDGCQPLRC